MLLTPNKIIWGVCPRCNLTLNFWENIPAEAVGSVLYHPMKCSNKKCEANLEVRVRVTFEVLLETAPEE